MNPNTKHYNDDTLMTTIVDGVEEDDADENIVLVVELIVVRRTISSYLYIRS